jgi:hypothetical protein
MRIFKSITTLLLITLLAACNINPSSSGSTSGSLSTPSNVNVSSIEIATTSSLTQFIGLTSKITVNATLNSGAALNTPIEWYINNEKSLTQTGLIFEFMPTTVNNYLLQARSGGVVSNTLTINVALPRFNVAQVLAKSSTQLEIKGDAGLSFSINGLTIGSSSSYNLINQIYTLNLLTPMIQGSSYSISIARPGFETIVYPFLYETRSLSVGNVLFKGTRLKANADGAYEISKPFTGSPSQSYTLSLIQNNLEGTSVPISIITNVPAGATSIAPYQTTLTIQKGVNITRDYTVSSTTEPGLYVHNINVNNVNLVVRIMISNPTPSFILSTPVIYDLAQTASGGQALNTPFATNAEGEFIKNTVKPNSNGAFVIDRPYNGSAYELTFILTADNFPTPLGFPAGSNPYNIIAALVGPTGGVMNYGSTVNTISSIYPFRESTGNNYRITQYIDNKTAVGTYTYTFTATGYGINLTRSIIIIVRELAPTIEPVITYNGEEIKANTDGSFTIFKPLGDNTLIATIGAKISNYESPLASGFAGGAGVTALYSRSGGALRYLLDTRITYTGPLSSIPPLITKLGLELGLTNTIGVADAQIGTVDYVAYLGAGATRTIDLIGIRDEEDYDDTSIFSNMATINSNTFPGVHTYTVQIGALTRTFIFTVVEPTPLIITRENVVQFGATSGSASKDNVIFNKDENKYYVDGKNGFIKINVLPFGMPTGSYPYTFTKRTPSGNFQSSSNAVSLVLRADVFTVVNGVNVYSERYDGTLKFPSSGTGSELAVGTVVDEQLSEEGEYIYTFTINNQFKEIRIVVLASPQLRIDTLVLNDVELKNTNGIYYVNHSTSSRLLDLLLNPLNIKDDYKYIINNTGTFPVGSSLNSALQDLVIIDGKIRVGLTLPAIDVANDANADIEPRTTTWLIALYKGSTQIGEVNKVVVISEPKTSTIFFVTNGGTSVKPLTGYVEANHGTFATITRTGYTFTRWNTTASLTGAYSGTKFIETDLFVYASWTANTRTVTFDKATGTGGTDNVTATFDAAMPTATAPTRSGHTFGGYFTLANGGGVQYYSNTMASLRNWDIDATTTLIARWIPNP